MSAGVVAAHAVQDTVPISYIGRGGVDSNVSGGNLAVAYPAGIQAGDFLWIPATAAVATAWGTTAFGSGVFTRRFSTNSGGSSPVLAGFYRFATGTESGTRAGASPGGSSIAEMFCYRGVDQSNPFDDADALMGSSTGTTAYTIPAQTCSKDGGVALLCADGNTTTGSWNPLTNYTELLDSGNGEAQVFYIGHRLNLTAGSTGARNLVRSGSVRGCAAGVLLKAA